MLATMEVPKYCEYSAGTCDQTSNVSHISDALFLYPSEPGIIAGAIEEAIQKVKGTIPDKRWNSWKEIGVAGQIIFCEICKSIKHTNLSSLT